MLDSMSGCLLPVSIDVLGTRKNRDHLRIGTTSENMHTTRTVTFLVCTHPLVQHIRSKSGVGVEVGGGGGRAFTPNSYKILRVYTHVALLVYCAH